MSGGLLLFCEGSVDDETMVVGAVIRRELPCAGDEIQVPRVGLFKEHARSEIAQK